MGKFFWFVISSSEDQNKYVFPQLRFSDGARNFPAIDSYQNQNQNENLLQPLKIISINFKVCN